MDTYIVSSYCEKDQTLKNVRIVVWRGGKVMSPFSLVGGYQHFRTGNKPDYTVSEPRSPKCESSLSWKCQMSYLKMCYICDLIIATGNTNLMNTA
jgi:hypothetical protein